MVNFGPLAAENGLPVLGSPANFNGFPVLAALLHGTLVSEQQPNFAAFNRGRNLYSAGRPSRWALGPHFSCLHLHCQWRTVTNDKRRLSKMKVKSESDVNESENPSDFRFARNWRNPTTFGFKLRHIPTIFQVDSCSLPPKWQPLETIRVGFYRPDIIPVTQPKSSKENSVEHTVF